MFQSAPPFRDLYKLPFHVLCLLTQWLLRVTNSQVQAFFAEATTVAWKVCMCQKTKDSTKKSLNQCA